MPGQVRCLDAPAAVWDASMCKEMAGAATSLPAEGTEGTENVVAVSGRSEVWGWSEMTVGSCCDGDV